MSVTLEEKAVSANHFPRLMFLNKSKHILSSPAYTEVVSASGTGMDCANHRVLMWQPQVQRCLDSPFLSLLPPHSGCEAVPWLPEETGACAGGHEHLPAEDPQHCLWGALLPPDVWGSSWLCQEDGGWLPVSLCPTSGCCLCSCHVKQCVPGIILLVFSHEGSGGEIHIGAFLYHQTERDPFLNAQGLPNTLIH